MIDLPISIGTHQHYRRILVSVVVVQPVSGGNRARYDSHLRSVSNGRGREVKARCEQIIN